MKNKSEKIKELEERVALLSRAGEELSSAMDAVIVSIAEKYGELIDGTKVIRYPAMKIEETKKYDITAEKVNGEHVVRVTYNGTKNRFN